MKKIQRALISATATVVKAQLYHSKVHEMDYSNLCDKQSGRTKKHAWLNLCNKQSGRTKKKSAQ